MDDVRGRHHFAIARHQDAGARFRESLLAGGGDVATLGADHDHRRRHRAKDLADRLGASVVVGCGQKRTGSHRQPSGPT
jgi:hypothetical protein